MSHTLYYDAAADCMVLTIEGFVTIDRIREIAPEVAGMCKETGCLRLLNDMRNATIAISILDAYDSPRVMDESGVSRQVKRALVVSPDIDVTNFLMTVTRNRGHDLMVFNDIEIARLWLIGD